MTAASGLTSGPTMYDGIITTCSGSLCNAGPWENKGKLGAGWIVWCWVVQCQHLCDASHEQLSTYLCKNTVVCALDPGITMLFIEAFDSECEHNTTVSFERICQHRCLLCSPRS